MDLRGLTIAKVRDGLTQKEFSCRELVQGYLDRIVATDQQLGAWLRASDQALTQATAIDQRLAAGQPLRPLEGVPLAVKDNIMMADQLTTAGSKILENYQAIYSATAVNKLQAAGAIVLGKTNLDEFGMGASTENSGFHSTKNPWDQSLVPGGSSGGSAVAVAADQCLAALGSDTGGSIRQPAAFCNVVGLKPTYGRVSRYGLIALASSLDQIGPLGRTVDDVATLFSVIAGPDDNDQTTRAEPVPDLNKFKTTAIKGLRIGWPKEYFGEGVDPTIVEVIEIAVKEFEKLGAKIVPVSLPHAPQGLPTYYIILPAEASSNLARYDGIRYGLSVRDGRNLEDIYRHTRARGFGAEVKRRIMVGTFSLSAGYADAYYRQAGRVRAIIREEFHQIFDQVDVLLTPTTPTLPFKLGAKTADPLTMYAADLLTVPANLANIPAISLPAGFINNLPVGMQLMAREWDEATLIKTATAYQQVTNWHLRQPPLT